MGKDSRSRDVTSLFLKYRADHKMKRSRFGYFLLGDAGESSHVQLLVSNANTVGGERLLGDSVSEIEMGEITNDSPIWVRTSDEVKGYIAQAREKITQLGKAERRRLLRVVDDESKFDAEIELLSHSISQLIRQADRGIQEIGRLSSQTVSGREIVLNVQKSLAIGLSQVSQELRNTQKEYIREYSRAHSSTTSMKEILDAGFTDEQLLAMEDLETRVESRNIEISKIAKSIHDLNTVFKDLGALVVEQGSILDRIDYNIENVVRHTEEGNRELRKAERIQKKSRVQKCILVLLVIIFLNFIFLFIR